MPSRNAVVRALDSCYDPSCFRERGVGVVDTGLIGSVEVREGGVRIRMVLTTGWRPLA